MNILTQKETLSGSSLTAFLREVDKEAKFFNTLKREGKTNYHRHPTKSNGKWYLEQLKKNTNGSFSTVKVLVYRIKSGKFIEQTNKLLSDSIGDQLLSLGFRPLNN